DDHSKVAGARLPHSLPDTGESGRQVSWFGNRCPQIQNQFTPFQHHLVGLFQSFFKNLPRRLVTTELRCGCMETQQQSLNSLKKRIVQLARDTLSLFQSLPETLVQLSGCLLQSQLIQRPNDSSRRQNAKSSEPRRLIKCRRNSKTQRCARFIPHAIIVARHHVECVAAWFQIRVK